MSCDLALFQIKKCSLNKLNHLAKVKKLCVSGMVDSGHHFISLAPKSIFPNSMLNLSITCFENWYRNTKIGKCSGCFSGKESACNTGDAGDTGWILGSGRSPGRGKWQPTPIFFPGKFRGQRSLGAYSPRGCKAHDWAIEPRYTQSIGGFWERKSHQILETKRDLMILKGRCHLGWSDGW